jgi:hypothetical protein
MTIKYKSIWQFVCKDKDGNIIWSKTIKNKIVNVGLQYLLDVAFLDAEKITTWYCGLLNDAPVPAAGDTMASHAGWTENTNYDEAVRQTISFVRSGQALSNSESPIQYTMSQDNDTIAGGFIISDNTKGGSTGTLMSVAAFGEGDQAANDGNTVDITITFTAADGG